MKYVKISLYVCCILFTIISSGLLLNEILHLSTKYILSLSIIPFLIVVQFVIINKFANKINNLLNQKQPKQ